MDEILQFFSDNKDALTAIGILLTFGVSIISLYFSVRNNRAVHYVNSVTKNRTEWIQSVRNVIAEFIAKTNVYNNAYYNNYQKMGEHLSECQNLCSKIKLLLNCCDVRDKEICDLVDSILELHRKYYDYIQNAKTNDKGYFIETATSKKCKKDIEANIAILIRKIHIYLKAEWNRVKYESKGKTYEKETQEFDMWELEQKYDNPDYKNDVWKRFCINSKAKLKRIWKSAGFSTFMFCVSVIIFICMIPQSLEWILEIIKNLATKS